MFVLKSRIQLECKTFRIVTDLNLCEMLGVETTALNVKMENKGGYGQTVQTELV